MGLVDDFEDPLLLVCLILTGSPPHVVAAPDPKVGGGVDHPVRLVAVVPPPTRLRVDPVVERHGRRDVEMTLQMDVMTHRRPPLRRGHRDGSGTDRAVRSTARFARPSSPRLHRSRLGAACSTYCDRLCRSSPVRHPRARGCASAPRSTSFRVCEFGCRASPVSSEAVGQSAIRNASSVTHWFMSGCSRGSVRWNSRRAPHRRPDSSTSQTMSCSSPHASSPWVTSINRSG